MAGTDSEEGSGTAVAEPKTERQEAGSSTEATPSGCPGCQHEECSCLSIGEVRSAIWGVLFRLLGIAATVFVIGWFIWALPMGGQTRSFAKDRLTTRAQEFLHKFELGGGIDGIYYIPPISNSWEARPFGIYYVKPETQGDYSEAMTFHLQERFNKNWTEVIVIRPDIEDHRELIGAPQFVYQDGVPVALMAYYRVTRVDKGKKPWPSAPVADSG